MAYDGGVEEGQGQGDGLVQGYQGGEGNRNHEGHVEEAFKKMKIWNNYVKNDHNRKNDA